MESSQAGTILGGLGVVVLLVLANAFFVAAEFALVGARRTRLEEMIREMVDADIARHRRANRS